MAFTSNSDTTTLILESEAEASLSIYNIVSNAQRLSPSDASCHTILRNPNKRHAFCIMGGAD